LRVDGLGQSGCKDELEPEGQEAEKVENIEEWREMQQGQARE
jgi:hypothetical protein